MKEIFSAICLALSLVVAASVAADSLSIVSDANWKSSAAGPMGWESVDFDDSSWPSARAPYPHPILPTDIIPGTTAEIMWHDPDDASDGTNGVNRAFFRYTFNLDAEPELAQAKINVDDDYAFYVNGALVVLNDDCGYAGRIQEVDFTDKLVIGKNVFAFDAVDGGCYPNSWNRGYERVLFDANITIPTLVSIDIKPGSDPNCFNVNGHGVIPVAILGTEDFDVNEIDLASLSFGGLEVRVRGNKGPLCSIEYSNEDAYLDLVCHFEDDSSAWETGDGEATLTGNLLDGTSFEGTDSICVVP